MPYPIVVFTGERNHIVKGEFIQDLQVKVKKMRKSKKEDSDQDKENKEAD